MYIEHLTPTQRLLVNDVMTDPEVLFMVLQLIKQATSSPTKNPVVTREQRVMLWLQDEGDRMIEYGPANTKDCFQAYMTWCELRFPYDLDKGPSSFGKWLHILRPQIERFRVQNKDQNGLFYRFNKLAGQPIQKCHGTYGLNPKISQAWLRDVSRLHHMRQVEMKKPIDPTKIFGDII